VEVQIPVKEIIAVCLIAVPVLVFIKPVIIALVTTASHPYKEVETSYVVFRRLSAIAAGVMGVALLRDVPSTTMIVFGLFCGFVLL